MIKRLLSFLITLTLTTQALHAGESLMQSEIKHVVVLMLENRSFDNVLAWLYDEQNTPSHFIPADSYSQPYLGLTDSTLPLYTNSLKDSFGHIVFTTHPIKGVPSLDGQKLINSPQIDPHEPFPHVMKQIFGFDGSAEPDMSGFLQDFATQWPEISWPTNYVSMCSVMETYTSKELPILYSLAKNYAVSDLWFSSVPTQTNPNRAFAACGTSEGEIVNGPLGTNQFLADTLWNRLSEYSPETTWSIFWHADMLPGIIPGSYYKNTFKALNKIPDINGHFAYMDRFHELARNGQLPDYSFIEPQWTIAIGIDEDWSLSDLFKKSLHIGIQGNDLHPPGDVRTAENLLANVYTSLIANKEAWEQTLLIITFDEHGGLYDHVPPPQAVSPDGYCQHGFRFDRLGVRVPTLFISPKIHKGTVIRSDDPNTPFDHTSVISTLLKWKGIDKEKWNLGHRVDAAPSFEQVITRTEARMDHALECVTPFRDGEPVKMGDIFYLKNHHDQYVAKGRSLAKMFAQVGSESDKLPMSFTNGSGTITHGSFVLVQSRDLSRGDSNILDILLTNCDCVYTTKRNSTRQWWTVKSVDHPFVGADICYGDRVYLENHIYLDPFQFIPARLAVRSHYNDFLTTLPITHADSDDHYWTIEKQE